MLDRITLFGAHGGWLHPARIGEGSGAWLVVSPQPIGPMGKASAVQTVRTEGGLIVRSASAPGAVEIETNSREAYQPPQKALRIGDAGPSWVDLSAPIELSPGDSLIVPEDRDAQDSVETLKSLLQQLPEDRQGLVWSALSQPQELYRLSQLEEEVQELRQAASARAEPAAAEPEKSSSNWGLLGAATVLGIGLGVGGMMLWPAAAPAPPTEPEAATIAPAAEPIPVLTVADLQHLDDAIASSPTKDKLTVVIGKDVRLAAGDDAGLIALAKLILLKADVKDLAALTPEQVVEKLGELAPDLGPYPKLLAQYACDSALTTIALPESIGGCAEAAAVSDIRLTYFNLLGFVSQKPAP